MKLKGRLIAHKYRGEVGVVKRVYKKRVALVTLRPCHFAVKYQTETFQNYWTPLPDKVAVEKNKQSCVSSCNS